MLPAIVDGPSALFCMGLVIVALLGFCLLGAGVAAAGALLLAKLRGKDTAPIWRIIRQEWNGKTDDPDRIEALR